MEKRILQLLTSHGTLVTPEVMDYISKKPDPESYVKSILKNLKEAPLYLTIDIMKSVELNAGLGEQLNTDSEVGVHTGISGGYEWRDDKAEEHVETKTVPVQPTEDPAPVKELEPKLEPELGLEHERRLEIEPSLEVTGSLKKPAALEYSEEIRVIKDVTGESTSEGTIKDFSKYFSERFHKLRHILQLQRREAMGSETIAQAKTRQGPVKLIGIVNIARTTKQNHKIIEIEDETETISILINNTSPLINMTFINDEVICVIGKLTKSYLVYVEDIIRPDVPITRSRAKADVPVGCLFMSDIHIGSNTFLHDTWNKFVQWLNGRCDLNGTEKLLDKLKYIVVSGDLVDGIGVYPKQELELDISDIYAQYENLANKFQDIPDHIKLIVQPGNHDAVRPAEPQPTFPGEITKLFNGNILFLGNPCHFKLHNVDILSYHGRSMDDFVMQIPEVTYNKPLRIMKEMLVRRHLAPIYGNKTPIAPEHDDYLVIEKIPDIFVTGHIHKTAVENYRDILLINASAWQSQTVYQKMMNFNPDPGKAVYTDLQSGAVQVLNFN
jgi:DNA polymerase II small subunit